MWVRIFSVYDGHQVQRLPAEASMKTDWLPEAVLALAFVVALVAQAAGSFP